jgi:hypothetical protein
MMRPLFSIAVLALAGAPAWCAEQNNATKSPPPRAVTARPSRATRDPGGVPRAPGGGKAMGPRITNPANPVSHLYRATPDERERALERIPAAQQEQMRKNLDWYDHLPKEQQQLVLGQAERFEALPPQGRQAFQQAMRELRALPKDRHQLVGGALRRLQMMPAEQRGRVLDSDQFKGSLSPEELKIISGLSTVMLPPQ